MTSTPLANRPHVTIFGNTNAGKSTLFNKILNQDLSIVSGTKGTTTDPVIKAMELIPFGPIALIDTAGLGDTSELGEMRTKKTMDLLSRTNTAIYTADMGGFDPADYHALKATLQKRNIPVLLVFTKADLAEGPVIEELKKQYGNALFVSDRDEGSIDRLKEALNRVLSERAEEDDTVIGNLLQKGSTVVLVVPVDSEAPKGRLILPQVQLIRDCLDHGMKCVVTRELELEETLSQQKQVDLVVTDSQAFALVSQIVPKEIKLTSFSMLLANKMGDIRIFIEGAKAVETLKDGAKILMAEACTHNHTHEDIGRVKIPNWLKSHTGKNLDFHYTVGHSFPESLERYSLIVHCGGCMINGKALETRLERAAGEQIPITNYGVLIAHLNGILGRVSEVFYGGDKK